eukprot:Awhi_evm1s3058
MTDTASILTIQVLGAEIGKECDSFVVIFLNGKKMGKSSVAKNCDSPVWKFLSGLVLMPGDHQIKLEVYENHFLKKTLIATAIIPYPLPETELK